VQIDFFLDGRIMPVLYMLDVSITCKSEHISVGNFYVSSFLSVIATL